MKLTDKQIRFLVENENLILASCSCNMPRAIMVEPSRILADKTIISNIQMELTNYNIKKNSNVFLVSYNSELSHWLKISGEAEVYAEGELYEEVKKLEEERCGLAVKEIIVVSYKTVQSGEE